MILKTKYEILNWLKKYDKEYEKNIKNNAYELIDIHDDINKSLLNSIIEKDKLSLDYFENLKKEDHQYIINVKGNIHLSNKKLEKIPIQFYHVDNYFDCSSNYLESLKGSPQYVGDYFSCANNKLKSLEYFPEKVNALIFLEKNQKLLKYKKQSIHSQIQNMSDKDFFNQKSFEFWQQFHLQEKIIKENKAIIHDLNLNKIDHDINKYKIKKI